MKAKAGEDIKIGDVVVLSTSRKGEFVAKLARHKNKARRIIGFAARKIKKGEIMIYDPSGKEGDILKGNIHE